LKKQQKTKKKWVKTPVKSGILLIQATDLKEKPQNTGADNARKTHRPEQSI
jgi:hypothetical protein